MTDLQANDPVCFHCGKPLSYGKERVGRRDSCPSCNTDVHVCKNCRHYDPKSYNECHEPQAERVVDKEKRNFCDYFVLGAGAGRNEKSKAEVLKQLDDLFKR